MGLAVLVLNTGFGVPVRGKYSGCSSEGLGSIFFVGEAIAALFELGSINPTWLVRTIQAERGHDENNPSHGYFISP